MNAGSSNKPYPDKRDRYRKDSMFKSARALAKKFAEWTPDKIAKRGEECLRGRRRGGVFSC
jgi:hypothetical protein